MINLFTQEAPATDQDRPGEVTIPVSVYTCRSMAWPRKKVRMPTPRHGRGRGTSERRPICDCRSR